MRAHISTDAHEVSANLAGLAFSTAGRVHAVVVAHGALLQSAVKRRAREPRTNPRPGQPGEGPRLLTGAYNRSINRRTVKRAMSSAVSVGTNAEQARRLEFGFSGTDAAGRTFDQQPYPHFGPALDDAETAFVDAIAEAAMPPGGTP